MRSVFHAPLRNFASITVKRSTSVAPALLCARLAGTGTLHDHHHQRRIGINMISPQEEINFILRKIDEDLESANLHSWIGVSIELYKAIKVYVSPVYHRDLAKIIAKVIDARI
jgi:hypothetical protein